MTLNAVNYFGFQFTNEAAGGATNYGWLAVTFGASAGERSITGYAYDNAGVAITVVPEPGTMALWLAGLAAVGGVAAVVARPHWPPPSKRAESASFRLKPSLNPLVGVF